MNKQKITTRQPGDGADGRTRREFVTTTQPVEPGDASNFSPEYLRTGDVQKVFGIRRGSLYGLAELGKVKGCLLRIRGQRLGVRLWSVHSIRSYIHSEMESAEKGRSHEGR